MLELPRFFVPDDVARACLRALSAMVCRDGRCLCVDADGAVALDLAGDAVFVVDVQRRILYFNERATQLTGYQAEEVLGMQCREGLRCVDCTEECALFGAGKLVDRQLQIRSRDGLRKLVVKDARVLTDANGLVVGGVETLHDVTDIQLAREEATRRAAWLQDRCRFLEAFAANLEEGMAAVDPEGRLLCLSSRAAELLGVPATCCPDMRLQDLVSDGQALLERLGFVVATRGRAEMPSVMPLNPILAARGTLSLRFTFLEPDAPVGDAVAVVIRRSPVSEQAGIYFGLLVHSQVMKRLVRVIASLARSDAPVLLSGESGVGKEMVARALHLAGARAPYPFVAFNCAALSDELVESELFGHERGAFTGAHRDKRGRMELCGEGTLLLDEVGCLSPRVQAKLLRVLETREFERVGGTRTLPFKGRIVSATNADLKEMVRSGTFRDDLFYRLRVVPVDVAPLRERCEDILPLAYHFARQYSRMGDVAVAPTYLTREAEKALVRYSWPGNVRELRSAIQYALALGDGQRIEWTDLPPEVCASQLPSAGGGEGLRTALMRHGNDRSKTAAALGISRTTLWRRMRREGLLD